MPERLCKAVCEAADRVRPGDAAAGAPARWVREQALREGRQVLVAT